MFMSESQKERRKREGWESIEIAAESIQICKRHKATCLKSWINTKQDEFKCIHTKTYSQNSEKLRQRKVKAVKEKNNILPTQESNSNENGFLIKNYESEKKIPQCFLNAEKKKKFQSRIL